VGTTKKYGPLNINMGGLQIKAHLKVKTRRHVSTLESEGLPT
jgi:hypothetical protein